MPAWLSYSLLRVGVFAVVLGVLLVVGLYWLWAALIATVIAFCVSYIFFRRQRLALAEQWATRAPTRTRDDVAEDAELESRERPAASEIRADRPNFRDGSGRRDGSSGAGSGRDGERERRAES